MKCSDLFSLVKVRWPKTIALDSSTSDQLNSIYWEIDSTIDHQIDHWLDIGTWAFHQSICLIADDEMNKGACLLKLSKVPMEIFNQQMVFNLEEDCWAEERAVYEQA